MRNLLVALLISFLPLAACAPQTQTVGTPFRSPALLADVAIMSDAARLPLRVWKAEEPRAIILGVHGFNDYSRAFELPGEWFAGEGISFYAFDQRGFGQAPAHGKWAGAEIMVEDLISVTALLRQAHPGFPIFVMGTSMGGSVTIAAAAAATSEDDKAGELAADGIILAAPAVWGWSSMNAFYQAVLWSSAHTMPDLSLTGEDLGRRASDNIDILRGLYDDPLVIKETRIDTMYGLVGLMDLAYLSIEEVRLPTLFLYGAKDEIVPRSPTEKVASRFTSDLTFQEYPNGWHMLLRDLQRETVWRDALKWIDRQHPADVDPGQ